MQRDQIRAGVIFLDGHNKNSQPRAVPVAKPGLPHLKRIPFTRTVGSLENEWRIARKASGLANLRYHDLRHTYASFIANSEGDLYVAARLLGNDPAYTTPRYAHLVMKTLKKAVRRVP